MTGYAFMENSDFQKLFHGVYDFLPCDGEKKVCLNFTNNADIAVKLNWFRSPVATARTLQV